MSKDKWNTDTKHSFIKKYIKNSSLWNVSDPDYAVKSKKQASYKSLMDEFGLSLAEVKNKIRIYRTTYGQEIKKMDNGVSSSSKLPWFNDLHKAFNQGRIKSFTKTSRDKTDKNEKMIEIEYEEEDSTDEKKSERSFVISKKNRTNQQSSVIIEPYFEYEEDQLSEVQEESTTKNIVNETSVSSGCGAQSNELFLKSLQSTLDKLPDDKNMRARIKIQEILYQIAYEIDQ